MHIILFGTGCDSCRELAASIEEAIMLCDYEITFEKTSDISRMLSYGIKSTPSIVLNEAVISVAQKLTVHDIVKAFNAANHLA